MASFLTNDELVNHRWHGFFPFPNKRRGAENAEGVGIYDLRFTIYELLEMRRKFAGWRFYCVPDLGQLLRNP
jgi:hypothetical protein